MEKHADDSSDEESEALTQERKRQADEARKRQEARAMRPQVKMQPMDISRHDELLCEGYLVKVKSNPLQNRTRFFRLTEKHLVYYEENSGKRISSVLKSDILSVDTDVGKHRFAIQLRDGAEIGRKNKKTEIVLEAPNTRVKKRWADAFSLDLKMRVDPEEVIVEGYLTKVQPMCTTNTTRFFRVTNRRFSYYRDEGGDIFGSVLLENIDLISATDDKREFKVSASVPMTKTAFYDIVCRAPSQLLRDKWVAMMQRVFPQHKIAPSLQMCCYMDA
eukprot:m.82495 g.82495  ORF g.82495 m.82495 type:complete len:275 (-) comp14921_c0_seq1:369-1193(-)